MLCEVTHLPKGAYARQSIQILLLMIMKSNLASYHDMVLVKQNERVYTGLHFTYG